MARGQGKEQLPGTAVPTSCLFGLPKNRGQAKSRGYKAVFIFIEGSSGTFKADQTHQGLHPELTMGHRFAQFDQFGPFGG